jgi:hypothetical protein
MGLALKDLSGVVVGTLVDWQVLKKEDGPKDKDR